MAESKTTPNAKPAPESYDEKFDRMKKRKGEREVQTTPWLLKKKVWRLGIFQSHWHRFICWIRWMS